LIRVREETLTLDPYQLSGQLYGNFVPLSTDNSPHSVWNNEPLSDPRVLSLLEQVWTSGSMRDFALLPLDACIPSDQFPLSSLQRHSASIHRIVSPIPERNLILSVGDDKLAKVWRRDNFQMLVSIPCGNDWIRAAAISVNGAIAVSFILRLLFFPFVLLKKN
jgi:hypothetical protein